MPKTETTQAISKPENQIANIDFSLPDDYSVDISREDVKMPSIVLWQKMTDMIEFEDANVKPGEFVNPVSRTNYGNGFNALIVKYYTTARVWGMNSDGESEVIKFSPDCIHWSDGTLIDPSEFTWTDDGSQALKSFHYLCILQGEDMPAVITFKGASAKFAKALNANLLHSKPAWRTYFNFYSAQQETKGNKYFVIQSKPNSEILLAQKEADFCLELWRSIKGKSVSHVEPKESVKESNGLPD